MTIGDIQDHTNLIATPTPDGEPARESRNFFQDLTTMTAIGEKISTIEEQKQSHS